MKIAFHNPYPTTINAYRTIARGFEHAFLDMGHEFRYFTPDDDFQDFFDSFQPDIFITATHFVYQKYIDYEYLRKLRNENGLVVFAKLDFWNLPKDTNQQRISEAKVMKDDIRLVNNIKNGDIADIFFHVVEQNDERMIGFEEITGYSYHTIPLAVDASLLNTEFRQEFEADISFIGTNSPDKRPIFEERLFPLRQKYNLKLYGQDWTSIDRMLGWIQRVGQYFNLPIIRSIRKPKLKFEDEGNIYKSSKISINLHEANQRICGGDCNERTFKIPAFGGFQITDDIVCIHNYFEEGKEIIIAKDTQDWFDKIEYYMHHPEEREKITQAGKARVLRDHTYHNRAMQFIDIYNSLHR